MKKYEYKEGLEARNSFEEGMKKLFKAGKKQRPPKRPKNHKSNASDKD